jgi:hypothetical protein
MTMKRIRATATALLVCLHMPDLIVPAAAQEGVYVTDIRSEVQADSSYSVQAAIALNPDGAYEFKMVRVTNIGTFDEADRGVWRRSGNTIVLSSGVLERAPSFKFIESSYDYSIVGVELRLINRDSMEFANFMKVLLFTDFQRPFAPAWLNGKFRSIGAPPVNRLTLSFHGGLRKYDEFTHLPVDSRHNVYLFDVDPGDAGFARFQGVSLAIENSNLVLPAGAQSNLQDVHFIRRAGSGDSKSN